MWVLLKCEMEYSKMSIRVKEKKKKRKRKMKNYLFECIVRVLK